MTHDDADLEQIIDELARRLKQTPRGSAEERLILRELEGLLPNEMAQPFMEDHGIFMNHRPVVLSKTPATVIALRPSLARSAAPATA